VRPWYTNSFVCFGQKDPDIDRLLHGSPLPETAMTFDDTHMRLERSNRSRANSEVEPDADRNDDKQVRPVKSSCGFALLLLTALRCGSRTMAWVLLTSTFTDKVPSAFDLRERSTAAKRI
jgi:hypothetical protein